MATKEVAEELRATNCRLCTHAADHGWWGDPKVTHCPGCHRTWGRTSREAHCADCHAHFGGARAFDFHLAGPPQRPAIHLDSAAVVNKKTGQRLLFADEAGVWRQAEPPQAYARSSGDGISGEGTAKPDTDTRERRTA